MRILPKHCACGDVWTAAGWEDFSDVETGPSRSAYWVITGNRLFAIRHNGREQSVECSLQQCDGAQCVSAAKSWTNLTASRIARMEAKP